MPNCYQRAIWNSYYLDSICEPEASSVLVSCVHNLFLDFCKPFIFFCRQTLSKKNYTSHGSNNYKLYMEGQRGAQKPNFIKNSIKLNWNFQWVGDPNKEKPSRRGDGYFLELHPPQINDISNLKFLWYMV